MNAERRQRIEKRIAEEARQLREREAYKSANSHVSHGVELSGIPYSLIFEAKNP